MAQKKSTLGPRIMVWLIIFGLGFAAGFFVRDTRKHEPVAEKAEEAIKRTRKAGEAISGGAKDAAGAVKGKEAETTP